MCSMQFHHDPHVWKEFPTLSAVALHAADVRQDGTVSVEGRLEPLLDRARARLAEGPEAELPEIRAWRRTFTAMGLKPTQYRCASEALLRRFRKEGALPSIAPIIDLCNALSLAYAIPVAVFDLARVERGITVRPAEGTEVYDTFSGAQETPEPGEIVFADEAGNAHARRWTNRQSARSAIRPHTRDVLVVAEALHDTAADDVAHLAEELTAELSVVWGASATSAQLSADVPAFRFA